MRSPVPSIFNKSSQGASDDVPPPGLPRGVPLRSVRRCARFGHGINARRVRIASRSKGAPAGCNAGASAGCMARVRGAGHSRASVSSPAFTARAPQSPRLGCQKSVWHQPRGTRKRCQSPAPGKPRRRCQSPAPGKPRKRCLPPAPENPVSGVSHPVRVSVTSPRGNPEGGVSHQPWGTRKAGTGTTGRGGYGHWPFTTFTTVLLFAVV